MGIQWAVKLKHRRWSATAYIELHTSGSCIVAAGAGGWGAVMRRIDPAGVRGRILEISGPIHTTTTNVRAEMVAVIKAVERLGAVTGDPITIFCGSDLIPNSVGERVVKWRAAGWKKSDGKCVPNSDLWDEIERVVAGRNVSWVWESTRTGGEHIERANELAYAAAKGAEMAVRFGEKI